MEIFMLNFKKLLSLALVAVILLTCASFSSYLIMDLSRNSIGVGLYESVTGTDAADNNGSFEINITACALLVDKDKRILDAKIDTLQATPAFTADGKYVALGELKTKGELGFDYNMVNYGASYEWFEHRDAFVSVIIGKNAEEIAALVTETGKGNEEVATAGCTIYISDFIKAINAAFLALKPTDASATDTVKLGISATATGADATAQADGSATVDLTAVAGAIGADGKITAAMTDAISVGTKFDTQGKALATDDASSKRELGENYGMKKFAGSALEWYEQADVFDEALVGVGKDGIPALMENGKGNSAITSAGCTIYITDFIKAALKLYAQGPSRNQIGIGMYESVTGTNAADANGSFEINITVCALLVDAKNRVVDCRIDTLQAQPAFTADGKYVALGELKTKGELGYDYNMVNYGASHEWFEHRDAFVSVVIGKTLDEISALITETGKGNDEVTSAGCTIYISDFIKAIDLAFDTLKPANAAADDELRLGITAASEGTDATASANGSVTVDLTAVAATVGTDGKVSVAITDAISVAAEFTAAGKANAAKDATSKRVLKENYGMKLYAGSALEWYEQADVYDGALVGVDKDGVAALTVYGKGNDAIVSAGCTIYITDFVKATNKLFD